MAESRVRAVFEADASGYIRTMGQAEKATSKLGTAADTAGKQTKQSGDQANQAASGWSELSSAISDNEQDLMTAGTAMLGVGATLTAVAGASTKFAMDWESAWTGVTKTNDGTTQQMDALEGDLRELARTLPATHEEIAGVAEAAGQLGVGVDDVSSFTRTMIDMGESTNLSAEEAATGLARFSNIMGTSFDDADKLGSTIVGLGNNFATTESEILDMSMRVAAIGDQMGMTEAEVMGLSTAMSSVGVRAEAGGTAISNTMKKIDGAVRGGGEALTGWAEAAGVSADEFATAWQERPAEAMVMLTSGLGEADAAGKDVNGMLSDLGITGMRESDTLLRLAGASDLLSESFALGSEEFDKNSALAEEAAQRYETAESKIAIAWNNIKDAAIDAGGALMPVVAEIADGVAELAQWFGELPDPIKGALGALSGVAGVAGLAAGGILLLAPRIKDTVTAFSNLRTGLGRVNGRFPKTSRNLRRVGRAAGIAAIALAGLSILDEVLSEESATTIQTITNELLKLSEAGDGDFNFDNLFSDWDEFMDVSTEIDGMSESIGRLLNQDWIDQADNISSGILNIIPGVEMESEIQALEGRFNDLGEAMSGMVQNGQAEQAASAFREVAAAFEESGGSAMDALEYMPAYRDELLNIHNVAGESITDQELLAMAMGDIQPAGEEAADGSEVAGEGMEGMGDSAEEAADKLKDVLDRLTSLGMISRDARQASRDYEQALDDMSASIEENGATFDENTEKGRANAAALDATAQANLDHAAAAAESGATQAEVANILKDGAQSYYDNALAIGHTEGEAERLTRAMYDIPPGVDIDTYMDQEAFTVAQATGQIIDEIPDGLAVIATMSTSAREEAWATAEAVDLIPNYEKVDVAVSENGTAGQVQASVNSITGKTEYVFVDDNGTSHSVQQQIVNIDGVDRTVWVDDNGTIYATKSEIQAMPDGDSTIWADADTSSAERSLNHAARDRYSTVRQSVTRTVSTFQGLNMPGGGATGGLVGRDFGLPRLASGGRLPYTGLGTDQIMGIGRHGQPTAMVDDGEWVTREPMSRKYNGVLDRINADHPSVQHLAGYANGGAVGREWSAVSMSMSAPNVHVAAPNVDTSGIREEVQAGLAGATIQFNMNGRTFTGMVVDAQKQAKSMGAR